MSESDQEDKSERPTPRRLEKAREEGQIVRSRELAGGAVVLACAAAIAVLGPQLLGGFADWMRHALTAPAAALAAEAHPGELFADVAGGALRIVLPLLAVAMLAAIAGSIFPGGWIFSAEPLGFKFSRLSPGANLGRTWSMQGVAELAKALLKVLIVGGLALWALWAARGELIGLGMEPVERGSAHALAISAKVLLAGAAGMLLIGLLDAPYQLWRHLRELRMTRQEVRQEMQDSEGRPEVKGKLRQLQREKSRARMIEAVAQADVVITNPTHVAVALRYDAATMRAPVLVAKGAGAIAERIREEAAKHRVPLLGAPPLARALHRTTEIGGEVPAALYKAVAQVLTWVYQLRRATGPQPRSPDIVLPDSVADAARPLE